MASDVFYNRIPYTQHRVPPPHDLLTASGSSGTASPSTHTQSQRSAASTIRSRGTLTFPPLFLDPVDQHAAHDPASSNQPNPGSQQPPGTFVLGSTFYHHPELNALVSNHLIDASANELDGTGHAFLSSIFANRDGGANDDDSDADEAGGGANADAAPAVPRPKITSEFVSLNEDLVPASLDMHGDMLPADQHPSYPFGNLFGPLGGMIAADSAIVGGTLSANAAANLGAGLGDTAATLGLDFGGGLDGFINLGQSSHGRRSAVSNAWNSFINKASRSKLVGSAGTYTDWNVDSHHHGSTSGAAKDGDAATSQVDTIRSAKKLDLSPNLLFRTTTSTVLAPPMWPFRRHGPGCTSYAALLRPGSNIYGSGPASQAVAATLGGLPASSKILKEVWSDLALEQLVPANVGETSAVRHLSNAEDDEDEEADAASGESRGKKRARTDPDPDSIFAKRVATMEADPLDLLGPISREIRGQASRPWGTATQPLPHTQRRRRKRRHSYSDESADSSAEAEHDDAEQGFAQRDLLRYSFALPPAQYSWTEEPDDEEQEHDEQVESTLHVEPDGIGWSTAKRIFVNEERDRLLPEVASRATNAGGLEAYRVRGLRANRGVLPRQAWRWGDGPLDADEAGGAEVSFATEMSASTSQRTDLARTDNARRDGGNSVEDSEGEVQYDHDDEESQGTWEQADGEDQELQRALLMQYQQGNGDSGDGQHQLEDEDDVLDVEEEEEAQVEYDLEDAQYDEEDEAQDDHVESFDEE
ncbi:L-kynurenine/alpha-aminoadipate aminotransferase [Pseudozyma hubeiensis SY62]|uniref:L-kynurenine/alpha-aminoadipate aminotransferase n=1 Tax=Pseudozyma hubeiensis (strain SY62) TaxID=1305764 RepID=R9P6G7_PSEHS|nr:L-kynurenine/alpha-aminoadipate aminotransferase [Pseudozyma hubeiensis SY62]GAC93700.1 L-kynurenine/alpha-aminoadipate aminotransferase [Pseudozyma hubeiensis SY62]